MIEDNIQTCNILGVNVSVLNMETLVGYIKKNIKELKGKYICVANVHTTVTSYENKEYCRIQNNATLVLPDGGPLSTYGKRKGYDIERTTGPDFMNEIFKISSNNSYKHFFYGSTQETLNNLVKNLKKDYKGIGIVGTYSPPFRELTKKEDAEIVALINATNPDFIWIGLGAPKQEKWMFEHKEKINGLMVGVGAGFDYFAGNIKRAPKWMQKNNLEWLYRLIQSPKKLFKRYLVTNTKFIWLTKVKKK